MFVANLSLFFLTAKKKREKVSKNVKILHLSIFFVPLRPKYKHLRKMIKPLTSLRMLFALMVFVSHCNIVSNVFDVHLLTEGYVGVSFFFVLSGFIIAYSYDKRFTSGTVTKRNFWVARIARIYPLHWLMLMVTAALGTYALSNGWDDWLRHFIPNLFLCQAYVPEGGYYFSFNSPSWSLCCEQLFYLLFPFLVPLLHKPHRLLVLFVLSAVAVVIGMSITPDSLAKDIWYVNPITRFPDFLLGMLVYSVSQCKERPVPSRNSATWNEAGAVILFVAFYVLSAYVPQVYRYSCYYWLPVACVIYVFARQQGALSRILSWRPLVWCGEVSFGFYLIHHLLFRLCVEAGNHFALSLSPYVAVAVVFIATMILSAASFYGFEQPMNKLVKRLFTKKQ